MNVDCVYLQNFNQPLQTNHWLEACWSHETHGRNKYCGFFFPRQLTYIDSHVVYYGTDSQLSVHQIAIWHQFTNHFHILIQHLLDFFYFFTDLVF